MLQTKRGGFTLIEVLAAISILGLVGLISSGFLLTILSSSSKAEVAKEVRQNGDYALSVMQGLILSAKSVSCPNSKNIAVQDVSGNSTTFTCDDTIFNKISSNSADLTGSNVAVSGCVFTCLQTVGVPTKVGIEFVVSQKRSGTLRPSEKSSQIFKSEIIMRNY